MAPFSVGEDLTAWHSMSLPRMTPGATPASQARLPKAPQRKGVGSDFKVGKEVGSLDPDKLITWQWVHKAEKTAEQAVRGETAGGEEPRHGAGPKVPRNTGTRRSPEPGRSAPHVSDPGGGKSLSESPKDAFTRLPRQESLRL